MKKKEQRVTTIQIQGRKLVNDINDFILAYGRDRTFELIDKGRWSFDVNGKLTHEEGKPVSDDHSYIDSNGFRVNAFGKHTPILEGRKDDKEKLRMDLIPPEAMFALADILTFGAKKYSDRNWEKGMKWGRPFGALLRHLFAWWAKEGPDKETGKSHLWHALCCLVFLIAYEERKIGEDDRP